MIEIKFYGRGGQGVVVAAQILARAYFLMGRYPQCYALFGGERRGAPVTSFLRVDEKKIYLKCEIKRPDRLIYFAPDLIDENEVKNTPAARRFHPHQHAFRPESFWPPGIAHLSGPCHINCRERRYRHSDQYDHARKLLQGCRGHPHRYSPGSDQGICSRKNRGEP